MVCLCQAKNILRIVHNMVQRHKCAEQAGLSGTQRAFAVLDEFCHSKNETIVKVFPEVVLIDSTHDANTSRYELFSFVVHDVFGNIEHRVNSRKVVEIFKENNPDWIKIRVAMTAKAVHEKTEF
ncbi:hypothetical protein PHPALM_28782 [Phytophthora palmivora]|uniref:ZSWIM1/3 RNaseH-like domain-containing protein n=1 Tax=Phytophthora palmivora TaxID=4796 RepID=A0A2P4X968_9STRA|nr:hypothetical protein PHPALM_28782 [Phytophthora palmivora]